jgi:hypothetical protein
VKGGGTVSQAGRGRGLCNVQYRAALRHRARKRTSRDCKLLEGGECWYRYISRVRDEGGLADERGESARLAKQERGADDGRYRAARQCEKDMGMIGKDRRTHLDR